MQNARVQQQIIQIFFPKGKKRGQACLFAFMELNKENMASC